jgi:hypothetical protein
MAIASLPVSASTAPPTISFDGERLDFGPMPRVEDGTLRVPVRKLLEAFGADVAWDSATREVVGTLRNRNLRISLAAEVMKFGDDAEVSLENRIGIVDGTLYAPLRALAVGLGAQVTWDEDDRTVHVRTSPTEAGAIDLEAIPERIAAFLEPLQDEIGFVLLSGWIADGQAEIEFRKYGEHERVLTPAELRTIQDGMYRILGMTFPLKLHQFVIPEQPDIEGTITKIDERTNRILVENPDITFGDNDDPEAVWISLTEDADVKYASGHTQLEVGQKVKAWFAGLMLQSYPGQTQAVKLEISEQPQGGESR